MTEPDWTDVTTQPFCYINERHWRDMCIGEPQGLTMMRREPMNPNDVPLFTRPIPQQQPAPNEWGAGYQDCRQFVVQRLCSQLPPAEAIRALDALGWPTDDASLRAVGVMR